MLRVYIRSAKLHFFNTLGVRLRTQHPNKYFKWAVSCWNGRKLLV